MLTLLHSALLHRRGAGHLAPSTVCGDNLPAPSSGRAGAGHAAGRARSRTLLGVAIASLLLLFVGPSSSAPAHTQATAPPATVTTSTGQVFTVVTPPTIAVTGGGDAFAGSQLVAQPGAYSPAPSAVGEPEWCEFGQSDWTRPETVGCARTVMGLHYIYTGATYTPGNGDQGWRLRVREQLISPVDGSTAYAWSAALLISYPLDYGSPSCPTIDESGAQQGKADTIPPHAFLGAVPESWPLHRPLSIRYGVCDNFPSPSVQLVVHPQVDVASAAFRKVVASSAVTFIGGYLSPRKDWKWSQTLTWTWKRPTAGAYWVCASAMDDGLHTAQTCKPLVVR